MRKTLSVAFALVCLLGAVSAQTTPGVVDSLGKPLSLFKPASRVISLGPGSTEVLFAIGAKVVGVTSYCVYPPEALKVERIGGFSADSMSLEKILSLRPDLVVDSGAIHTGLTKALANYGIPHYSYDPGSFEDIARGIRNLGTLTGRSEQADVVAATMLNRIDEVKRRVGTLGEEKRKSVFWEVYNEPLMTCGSATFQHAIVEAGGGRDIFADLPGSWPMVSNEEVIKRAPEVIMGADDHGDNISLQALRARPGWSLIPAVKNGKVIILPTGIVSNPGPRVAEGVRAVAEALYPELFR
ncbi:MAG: cobalamin-binding protein [Spirochaetia bacterium]|jgi:iron complex transport system substrate-binding protein|uniref:Periplasmic binding protein n=2 Tax=root TaxID=1 RepID=A0A652ZSX2_9SPIR|nr:cobalamin-binding protein [Spirochaetia bacterium]NLX44779.1 cobalamin-binding protein [Treponema sp.]VBB38872.1 Periplasmic binding protein [uncultured Spirochaetota bacterium]HAP54667.1 cobalamin-binding protein [Spirochaetaceae bacterium]HOI23015.1 cobalamin-binding protein [Spirochaetales bacterium]